MNRSDKEQYRTVVMYFIHLFIKSICICNAQLMQKAQQRCYKSVAAIWTKKFPIPSGNSQTGESVLLEEMTENSKHTGLQQREPVGRMSLQFVFLELSNSNLPVDRRCCRPRVADSSMQGSIDTHTVLTFVDHGRQFEDDSSSNWKPMQISKNWSDMIVFPCVRDKSSSHILDMLQLVQQAFIDAMTQRVAVVQSNHEERIHWRLPGIWCQRPSDQTYICHSWKKQDRQRAATWSVILSWLSRITSESDTDVEIDTVSSCNVYIQV